MASKPRLHTCKTERFKITLPPLAVEEKGIVEEAIWLMRRHFFRSFPEATWDRLRAEITHFSDPNVALANLMDKFGCPYTRFIQNDAMTTRQRNIKGEMGTTGIELGRRWLPPREIMSNFLHWISTLSLSTTLKSPAFLLSGAKLLFDTTTPIVVASIVHNSCKSSLSAASGGTSSSGAMTSFSRLLSVPVCRFLYTACVIFAMVTTTCRIAAAARPMHVLSLSDPQMEGESSLPSFSRRQDDADLGGLQRGDIISHVDGDRIRSFWSSRAVLRKLNDGEVGSTLQVTTRRRRRRPNSDATAADSDSSGGDSEGGTEEGDLDSRTVVVQRHAELISNVQARVLPASQGSGLGYMAIDEFTEKTREEVEAALQGMKREIQTRDGDGDREGEGLKGLVVDLRGNPGGPIGSAFDVASLFLGSGTVLSRTCTHREKQGSGFLGRFKRGKDTGRGRGEGEGGDLPLTLAAGSQATKTDDPERIKRLLKSAECHSSLNPVPDQQVSLLLLMDASTASASEIMIAALSCHGRALTMGSPTKGKNVAQALVQMSDGSGLAFTIREYLDPRGGYMGDGITPHIPTAGLGISERELVGRIVHHGDNQWSLGQT